jgi:hypothetical protein
MISSNQKTSVFWLAVPGPLFLDVLGTNMKKVDIFQFYTLATALKSLQAEIQTDVVLKDVYYQLFHAKILLENLVGDGMIPIVVCRGNAWKILNAINTIIEPTYTILNMLEPIKKSHHF